jgi:N-acetylglucosaminyldiphosphoundecaprenol N-acetyl-beta-D-mannosaminyltransferase
MDDAVATVGERIAAGRLQRVVVTNANKAWLAARNPELRAIVESADLIIPEYAIAWGARRLRMHGIYHVGGLTLMRRLLIEAPARGWTIYLLGGRAAVVDRLADRLRAETPALRIVGWHHGYLDAGAERRVRAELARHRPDLLFVGMGSPRQEQWIAGLREAEACIAMGVGGSFDVLAGVKRDAPRWLHGNGLEWLFRLSQDPRNLWKRYLVTNPWFVWQIYRQAWQKRS